MFSIDNVELSAFPFLRFPFVIAKTPLGLPRCPCRHCCARTIQPQLLGPIHSAKMYTTLQLFDAF